MAYEVEKYYPNFITCSRDIEQSFYMWDTVDTVEAVKETACWKECISSGQDVYVIRRPKCLRIMQGGRTKMYVLSNAEDELERDRELQRFIDEITLPYRP